LQFYGENFSKKMLNYMGFLIHKLTSDLSYPLLEIIVANLLLNLIMNKLFS
jgi:hypothetical protein